MLSINYFKKNTLENTNKKITSTLNSIEFQIITHCKNGGDKYLLLKVLAKYKYNTGMYINEKSKLIRIGVNMLIKLLRLLVIVISMIILKVSNITLKSDNVYSIVSKIANSILVSDTKFIIIVIFMLLLYIRLCIFLIAIGKQEKVMSNVIIFVEDIIESEYSEN